MNTKKITQLGIMLSLMLILGFVDKQFVLVPGVPGIKPGLSNVILTPHCGSNTQQARYEMARQASLRINAVLSGQLPENLLNPEALNR